MTQNVGPRAAVFLLSSGVPDLAALVGTCFAAASQRSRLLRAAFGMLCTVQYVDGYVYVYEYVCVYVYAYAYVYLYVYAYVYVYVFVYVYVYVCVCRLFAVTGLLQGFWPVIKTLQPDSHRFLCSRGVSMCWPCPVADVL